MRFWSDKKRLTLLKIRSPIGLTLNAEIDEMSTLVLFMFVYRLENERFFGKVYFAHCVRGEAVGGNQGHEPTSPSSGWVGIIE